MATASNALDAIETAVDCVLASERRAVEDIDELSQRESVSIARALRKRLDAFTRHGNCRRCWLQVGHCVCEIVRPVEWAYDAAINRIFVVMHHKEVLLAVDTAKLICAVYPGRASLVVFGLGSQPLWDEMIASIQRGEASVLFPTDSALRIADAFAKNQPPRDLVILDGTWVQARKMLARLPPELPSIQLSRSSVDRLATGQGRQLRKHPEPWREVSTLGALCLALEELPTKLHDDPDILRRYQHCADTAALRQLGPIRRSQRDDARRVYEKSRRHTQNTYFDVRAAT